MQTDRPSINPTFYEFLISLHKSTINIQSLRNESTFFLSLFSSLSCALSTTIINILIKIILILFSTYFVSLFKYLYESFNPTSKRVVHSNEPQILIALDDAQFRLYAPEVRFVLFSCLIHEEPNFSFVYYTTLTSQYWIKYHRSSVESIGRWWSSRGKSLVTRKLDHY